MNAPAFTPGPWVQGHAPGAHWVNLPGLARGINAGSAANAALIAAAPDGYALAELIVSLESSPLQSDYIPPAVMAAAKAFIAKAQGGAA